MVRWPNGDADFCFVTGVLHIRYISTISIYNLSNLPTTKVDKSNERKLPDTEKGEKQTISAETPTDADYTDDQLLLVNIPA